MSAHYWFISPCIASMWVYRLIMGQAFAKGGKFGGIKRGYEAPKLNVDEIYHPTSDEEQMIRDRRNGRRERKEKPPARIFLQWYVEHLGKSDNKVRSPQEIMEAFVYECMGDNQERLVDTGFADDFFVHLMENRYIRRYFLPIIPRIEETINLTYCTHCDSPGMQRVHTNHVSLTYLTGWKPDMPGQSIQSLVENHFNAETSNDEACPNPQCSKDGGKKTRRNRYQMLTLPEGFVVKLVRGLWNQEEDDVVENTDPIDLGDQEATIKVSDEDAPVKFKLVATVRHTGNNEEGRSSTGHFLCYLKHGQSWHCWNDAHYIESDVNMDEVRRSELFLFVTHESWPEHF